MEKYADYEWYSEDYLMGRDPVIPETLFDYYATVASAEVNNIVTLDLDLSDPDDAIKAATCEVAEILCKMDGNDEDGSESSIPVGISSEKVGEYSVTYAGNTAIEKDAEKKSRIKSAMVRWLGTSGYLYRGV